MYCILLNGVAFNFTCAVDQGGLTKYRQTFKQIAESIKIEKLKKLMVVKANCSNTPTCALALCRPGNGL